jgi:aromatic-L-amino-acid decarboxylase
VRQQGLAGRTDVAGARVYCSEQAHSSVDKAVIVLGLGHDSLVRIPPTIAFACVPICWIRRSPPIESAGCFQSPVVATLGTTSTTSLDPVREIADVCERHRVWLHVDAAYAGVTAMLPSHRPLFTGWERADSIVVNPHKWLFVPVDLSAFYCRRGDLLRQAFSARPRLPADARGSRRYAQSHGHRDSARPPVSRPEALDGVAAFWRWRLASDLRGASSPRCAVCALGDEDPDFERLAPVPFSVVCFRARPAGAAHDERESRRAERTPARHGQSQWRGIHVAHAIACRMALRLAIGHLRTTEQHVARAWSLLREGVKSL